MKHFTLPKEGGLIEKGIPADILHGFERIRTEIYDQSSNASDKIADIIVNAINACKDRNFRLGLSTGSTPASLYREHMMKERYHSGMLKYSRLTSITLMAKTSLKAAIGDSVRLCSMALTFLRRIFIFRTAVFPRIKSAITAQSMTRRSGAWIFSL